VADHDFFRIDVCFECDIAAKASAVDLHLATPCKMRVAAPPEFAAS
jgi:hypothetical protein